MKKYPVSITRYSKTITKAMDGKSTFSPAIYFPCVPVAIRCHTDNIKRISLMHTGGNLRRVSAFPAITSAKKNTIIGDMHITVGPIFFATTCYRKRCFRSLRTYSDITFVYNHLTHVTLPEIQTLTGSGI